MPAITRTQLQMMAQAKADDADLLFRHGRHSNAYYLFGYSVEIGLKACIARQFVADAFPDKDLVKKIYIHNLSDLVRLAGLQAALDTDRHASPPFKSAWTVISAWTEEVRYEMIDGATCSAMRDAVLDQQYGGLSWLKRHW